MVGSKTRRKSTKPASPIAASDGDPLSWLFINPLGPTKSGLKFGVLRQEYGGRKNSALEFGWCKAHPQHGALGADFSQWAPTAERLEVILPAHADEMLSNPSVLLTQMDRCALECDKALLIYLTLPLAGADRVHIAWEQARAFVREKLSRDRDLATVLTLHAPGTVGAPYPMHAHCLVVPRRIEKLGLRHGRYDEELTRDSGQAVLDEMWAEHTQAFR